MRYLTCLIPILLIVFGFSCRKAEQDRRPPDYMSNLEAVHSQVIGWAWDRNNPDDTLKVDIYDGNTLVGTITADQFREDLLKEKIGNGKHSFIFPIPALQDGKRHVIRALVSGTRYEFEGSPARVTLPR